jgi:hypothetical protein
LKRYKSPGTDQIPAELIQAGGKTLCSKFHIRINSILEKEECHSSGMNSILYLFKKE